MQSLTTLAGQALKWTQPKASKMQYELRSGAELKATLRFRSAFGSFATAESADGCWTFKRVGFWQPRVIVRACESDTDIATFVNNTWTGGGTLTLANGRKLLVSTNMWMTQYEIKSESDTALVRYKMSGVIHLAAEVEIQPAALELPELPWLVPLGWYLAILAFQDSANASVAAIS